MWLLKKEKVPKKWVDQSMWSIEVGRFHAYTLEDAEILVTIKPFYLCFFFFINPSYCYVTIHQHNSFIIPQVKNSIKYFSLFAPPNNAFPTTQVGYFMAQEDDKGY